MTTAEGSDDFLPDPFPTAPEEPGGLKEWSDGHTQDEIKKVANEATAAAQQAAWAVRRQQFLRKLDFFEKVWFG